MVEGGAQAWEQEQQQQQQQQAERHNLDADADGRRWASRYSLLPYAQYCAALGINSRRAFGFAAFGFRFRLSGAAGGWGWGLGLDQARAAPQSQAVAVRSASGTATAQWLTHYAPTAVSCVRRLASASGRRPCAGMCCVSRVSLRRAPMGDEGAGFGLHAPVPGASAMGDGDGRRDQVALCQVTSLFPDSPCVDGQWRGRGSPGGGATRPG
jgi:hypothetical protein